MVEKLLTKLRGKDYRPAYLAIPQLCRLLDPDNLPWPHNVLAEKKGVRLVATISDLGTGLLEIKLLESALKQIRARR